MIIVRDLHFTIEYCDQTEKVIVYDTQNVCMYLLFLNLFIFIYLFYIKDELRVKISEKISLPPHKQHFLNWTMRSYDDRVGIILIIL